MAMSLPRRARRSLRLPASWATEINLQSRYPGGILIPKMGAASSSACPEAGARKKTALAKVATATSEKVILFIVVPLQRRSGAQICHYLQRPEISCETHGWILSLSPRMSDCVGCD